MISCIISRLSKTLGVIFENHRLEPAGANGLQYPGGKIRFWMAGAGRCVDLAVIRQTSGCRAITRVLTRGRAVGRGDNAGLTGRRLVRAGQQFRPVRHRDHAVRLGGGLEPRAHCGSHWRHRRAPGFSRSTVTTGTGASSEIRAPGPRYSGRSSGRPPPPPGKR